MIKVLMEDIANLFEELSKNENHRDIARHFGRERKFVINMKYGCGFHMTPSFLSGLDYYGYELKLVKKGSD